MDSFRIFALYLFSDGVAEYALFNQIAKSVPEAQFVWIGGGELETELDAPNVEVTGWKSRDEALRIAKGANAFILCSLGEAIAMSLIESMYMKKLCLVSNTMGNKSVIKDEVNGYLCESAEDYTNRLKAAIKEYPYALVSEAYQNVLSIYNARTIKEKFVKFYSSLID